MDWLPIVLLLSVAVFEGQAYMSAFYADNGLQQTWPMKRIDRKVRKELQNEILTLLGLHHRPKPARNKKEFSGPRFLLDVYKSMEIEGDTQTKISLMTEFNTTRLTMDNIQHADMIMSLVNKGEML